MATLTLGSVFEETKNKYQLKLLAGAEGLHRSLRWLYFSEDIGNAEFLRGGELMVITGFGLQGEEELSNFVRMLIGKHCCGLILNVGKYIEEEALSPALLALCDEEQFPLIRMPWKFHLTDIIQEYSRRIFFRTHEQDRLRDIFALLMQDRKLCSVEDEAALAAAHYDPQGRFSLARFARAGRKGEVLPATLPRDLHVLTENHLNQEKLLGCALLHEEELILLLHQTDSSRVHKECIALIARCEAAFPQLRLRCGLGTQALGIDALRESYQRAGLALRAADWGCVRAFSSLGVQQLFFTCRDEAVLCQFVEILAPLEAYDKQYGSQLVETLRLYLHFGGRVNMVSDEMYCHRNTTNYRIKKIKALLEMDLDERECIFRLQLAFHLREYQTLMGS